MLDFALMLAGRHLEGSDGLSLHCLPCLALSGKAAIQLFDERDKILETPMVVSTVRTHFHVWHVALR
jgi:hypothetical protein